MAPPIKEERDAPRQTDGAGIRGPHYRPGDERRYKELLISGLYKAMQRVPASTLIHFDAHCARMVYYEWNNILEEWSKDRRYRRWFSASDRPARQVNRSGNKTLRPRTAAQAGAFARFVHDEGFDLKWNRRRFAKLAADHAMKLALPGAGLLEPGDSSMREMAGAVLASLAL